MFTDAWDKVILPAVKFDVVADVAAVAVEYPIPSTEKASNGFWDISFNAPPPLVIVPGVTAAVVTEVVDWQHKSFVLVIFVSGVVEGVKFEV